MNALGAEKGHQSECITTFVKSTNALYVNAVVYYSRAGYHSRAALAAAGIGLSGSDEEHW